MVPLSWLPNLHAQQDVAYGGTTRKLRYFASSDSASSSLHIPFLLRFRNFLVRANFLRSFTRGRLLLVLVQIAGLVIGEYDSDRRSWAWPSLWYVASKTLVRLYLVVSRSQRPRR